MTPSEAEIRRETEIVENAARLLRDAKLLADNNRFASAFALALLATEELGKLILRRWEAYWPPTRAKSATSHIRKQMAVASLVLSRFTIENFGHDICNSDDLENMEIQIAKAFSTSSEGRLFRNSVIGALDKTKQIAFYRDDWHREAELHPDQFDKSDVEELFDVCRKAIDAVFDFRTMHVARAIYISEALDDRPTR